jgi:3',5'-cyclic AMP phosphodiesterase CpdA
MIIAQISDFHLRPAGSLAHDVVDTAGALASAVGRLARLRPPPDAVLATGDLADAGTPEDYRQLRRQLAPLPMPVYLIPGNRDGREALRAEFAPDGYLPAEGPFLNYAVERFPVRLIGLDTVDVGRKTGALCADRLAWLEARLAEHPRAPAVVFMHHPPFKTGVPFMDEQAFQGAESFERLIARHPQVERVLCGHLHRPILRRFGGTLAAVAPATCFQMPLDLEDGAGLGLVLEPAAGLLHLWSAETGMVTHLLPLAAHPGPFPFKRRPAAQPM